MKTIRDILVPYITILLVLSTWLHVSKGQGKTVDTNGNAASTITGLNVDLHEDTHHTEHKDLTPEEIEAKELYEKAESILYKSSSPSSEDEAYKLFFEAALLNHTEAKLKISWSPILGKAAEMNMSQTEQFFEELAQKGNPEAQMGLGFMHATGIGKNSSQAKALVYYMFGALGGNPWAQMALGYRYWAGISVSASCESALSYYKKVARKVSEEVSFSGGRTIHRVRLLDEMDNPGSSSVRLDENLIQYYQLLAEKGDIQAQVGLGQLHYQGGRGVELDHERALGYFSQAAESGNPNAMAFLGKMYMEGSSSIKADNETAFKYFKKAADLNNAVGQAGLGLMYLQGRYVKQDYSEALKYFSLAAKQGWVDGQLHLGNMYFNGLGVRKDYKMAIKYFNLASQSGNILAFYNLAQMQASGTGMLRSCHTAAELFKNVAERGHWGELLMDAHALYWNGKHVEALVIYMLLAELGYEVAQSNAAFILDRHEVDLMSQHESYTRALMYWGHAASQGYAVARVKLGDYHYYGFGTTIDYEAAAIHYRLAFEQQQNAQAMFNLGYMHEQGLGLKQDFHLAKRFYDMAAEASVEAQVPVALALAKLAVIFFFRYVQELEVMSWKLLGIEQIWGQNWDIYVIVALIMVISTLIFLRNRQD